MKSKKTIKKILLGVLLGFLAVACALFGIVVCAASFLLGLALRAVNRSFDTAVITLTVYFILKYLKVTS